jgi:hypothetical protein
MWAEYWADLFKKTITRQDLNHPTQGEREE